MDRPEQEYFYGTAGRARIRALLPFRIAAVEPPLPRNYRVITDSGIGNREKTGKMILEKRVR